MDKQASDCALSAQVWEDIAPIMERIRAHPFITTMAAGTLQRSVFTHYLAQDAHYLTEYGRALAAAASQSQDPQQMLFWAQAATNALQVEQELHRGHVGDLTQVRPSPTCVAYTDHLLAQVGRGSYPVLVAALLPCFWIYCDVGEQMLRQAGDLAGHEYGDWIATYADPDFRAATEQAIAILDELACGAGPVVRRDMREAFVRSARYEWMFWDAAHRLETWPI